MARQYTLKKDSSSASSGIDYRAELNEQQFAAVSAAPGPTLVIAGAGSGKTRALTYRVAYLLDQGIEPRNMLLLTFTNKAAREMSERVGALVKRDMSALWSGTFHSIGSRILRRHAEEMGLTSSFSILDRDDQKSIINTVIADCEIDTKERRFPRADVLAGMFSLERNTGESLQDIISGRYSYFEEWGEEIAKIAKRYTAKKLDANSVDFDDLLILPLELFRKNAELAQLYQQRFQFILVDEYQDTNHVQSELIDLLSQPTNSVMVVGDDAQSIYSWRGANMDHILSFPQRYPEAQVFKIETNYRSVPEVLELSNAAIRGNRKQFEKTLKAARVGGVATPALVPVEDPRAQASFVAQRLLELRDEGVELNEMAVLYRAHHQSLDIQLELTSRGIPFAITSGLRFFEQTHMKDIACFMRLMTNPRDEVSFKRMVLMMPGVGPKSADKLWRSWKKAGLATDARTREGISKKLLEFSVPKKAKKDWEQICYTMDELAPGGDLARPADMIYSILEGVYDAYMQENFDNYEQRLQDVEQLRQYAENYDDVLELLEKLSLMSSADGDPKAEKAARDDESVTLTSIHQAKGLEWKVVFLIWLTEGMFPNGRIVESEDEDQMEEERRLFYVAVTRAKDELYLLYPLFNPKSYTGDVMQRPSRFLDELPDSLTEKWQVDSAW